MAVKQKTDPTKFRFPELQKYMDMALAAEVGIKVRLKSPEAVKSFVSRISAKKSDWRQYFLMANGFRTKEVMHEANHIATNSDLQVQLEEAGFGDLAKTKRYHWQSPYDSIVTRQDSEDKSVVYLYNMWYSKGFDTSVLDVEFLQPEENV